MSQFDRSEQTPKDISNKRCKRGVWKIMLQGMSNRPPRWWSLTDMPQCGEEGHFSNGKCWTYELRNLTKCRNEQNVREVNHLVQLVGVVHLVHRPRVSGRLFSEASHRMCPVTKNPSCCRCGEDGHYSKGTSLESTLRIQHQSL